tara:strand:+ start:342 stop:530 length:189 start_codon:yes stop_codon:yes gene_type:complete
MKIDKEMEDLVNDISHVIYADDYVKWNKEKGDFDSNDKFTGSYLDAHEYARKKYGKRYTISK